MVSNRKYFRIGCKINKFLVLPIDIFKIVSVHVIIQILVPIAYLRNIFTDWQLGNQYIVEIVISWKGWTAVRVINNIQGECKNNTRLVWSKKSENWNYGSDPWNINFDDLSFDCD